MNPSKIVITGTIASGKSTLVNILEYLGFVVLSADEVNRDLLKPGQANYEAIKNSNYFADAFVEDKLDKKKLAQLIFSDGEKLLKLNSLTHPNILAELDKRVEGLEANVVFIEIPLYYQMEEKYLADEVWLVVSDLDIQLARLMERDQIDLDYAKAKIETQEELIEMKEEADVIFDNSTSVTELKQQIINTLESKGLL